MGGRRELYGIKDHTQVSCFGAKSMLNPLSSLCSPYYCLWCRQPWGSVDQCCTPFPDTDFHPRKLHLPSSLTSASDDSNLLQWDSRKQENETSYKRQFLALASPPALTCPKVSQVRAGVVRERAVTKSWVALPFPPLSAHRPSPALKWEIPRQTQKP